MALASLVSFQYQEQKHKSDYELAKDRIFLKQKHTIAHMIENQALKKAKA
jgi:hypothetical protein